MRIHNIDKTNFNGQIYFYLQKAGVNGVKGLQPVNVCSGGDQRFVKIANNLMSKDTVKISIINHKSGRYELKMDVLDEEATQKFIKHISKFDKSIMNPYLRKILANENISSFSFVLSNKEYRDLKFDNNTLRIFNYFKLKKFENTVRELMKKKNQAKLLDRFFGVNK